MSARLAAIGAALALAGCAGSCGDSCRGHARQGEDARPLAAASPAPRDAGQPSVMAQLGLPSPQPRWHVVVPGAPAATALEHVAGPVVMPGSGPGTGPGTGSGDALVLVASGAAGVVAIAADTGVLRWQHAGEQAPGLPVVASNGDEVWLPGRCADRMHEAQALFDAGTGAAGQREERVLGCVDVVERAGHVRERVWIRVDEGALDTGGSGRSSALGRRGENLIWGYGHDLLEISMPAGRVVAHRRALISDSEDGAGAAMIKGWSEQGPHLVVATTTGLAGFAGCPAQAVCTPAWRLPWPRAVGVTGPVQAGSNVAWVRDQILEAGRGGHIAWTAPGFHSYGPGSLMLADQGTLLALRLGSDGIQPVRIEPESGRTVEHGTAVPGAQVLAATSWGSGLAAVVRLDASLRRDVVIAWDETLNARWAWPVPEPARPRIEPVGLAALPESAGGGVIVFHDGRFVTRLPPAAH